MRPMLLLLTIGLIALTPIAQAEVPIPVPSARAIAFHEELFWLWLLEHGIALAIPALLLFTGWGATALARCRTLTGNRPWIATLLVTTFFSTVFTLGNLATELVRDSRLAPYFGDLNFDLADWLSDEAGSLPVTVVMLLIAGLGLLALIRFSPRRWWLWASCGLTLAASVYLVIQPRVDGQMKTYQRIEDTAYASWAPRFAAIAARAGAHGVPVLVRPTTAAQSCRTQNSAIGLGPTRAVVLADQIFTQWQPGMVEVSFAHELKHYLHDNTWLPVALLALLSLGGAFSIYRIGTVIAHRQRRAGIESLASPAALPLWLLLLQLYLLVAVPAFNLVAQQRETGADRFALELTRDKHSRAMVSASVCGNLWLAEDPLFERLYLNTHPSVARRIRLANAFQP